KSEFSGVCSSGCSPDLLGLFSLLANKSKKISSVSELSDCEGIDPSSITEAKGSDVILCGTTGVDETKGFFTGDNCNVFDLGRCASLVLRLFLNKPSIPDFGVSGIGETWIGLLSFPVSL